MHRSVGPLVLALAVVTLAGVVAGATPPPGAGSAEAAVGLHGNHVAVDAQVSADGHVVVESLSLLSNGYVAIHADDGGEPGEVLGHTSLSESGFRTRLTATIDEGVWREWGDSRTVWAVVHRDDGDGTFEPGEDRALTRTSPAAAAQFPLGKADRDVRVLAPAFGTFPTNGTRVTVPEVALAEQGYVAVVPDTTGAKPLGVRRLPRGTHENVTVSLDAARLANLRSRFRARFVVYRDDGDGLFTADDAPVRVGGRAVATTVVLEQRGNATTETPSLINTPTGTVPPTTVPPTATESPIPSPPPSTVSATGTTATSGSGSGFNIFTTAVVMSIILVVARSRA